MDVIQVPKLEARMMRRELTSPSSNSRPSAVGYAVHALGNHPGPIRPRGLEAPAHVKFTVGTPLNFLLAAEMEIPVTWVADGPAAIAWQKREDRLSLLQWNN